MKFLNNKGVFEKVIITIIIIVLCNFSLPNICYGATDISDALCDFFCALPDAGFYVLQHFFLGEGDTKIAVHSDKVEEEEGGILNYIPGVTMLYDGDFDLPNIRFTPYAIFSNSIPLLNANFFSEPINKQKEYFYFPGYNNIGTTIPEYQAETEEEVKAYIKSFLDEEGNYINENDQYYLVWYDWIKKYVAGNMSKEDINEKFKAWIDAGVLETTDAFSEDYEDFAAAIDDELKNEQTLMDEVLENPNQIWDYIFTAGSENFENYEKMESKFKPSTDINENQYDIFYSLITKKTGEKLTDSTEVLKPIVSKWYGILRSIAIIGLLTVLVYISIRIIISSISEDKAKYKQMLKDWLVAMCLVFVLHYIMSFTMMFTQSLIEILEDSNIENRACYVPDDIDCLENDILDKAAYEKHYNKSDSTWICNSIEYIRYCVELNSEAISVKLAYVLIYMVLCIQTYVFTFQYLKRVVYMTILTLLAPIIAFTYPIDKISDKKAQGFNMWLKEYIFNALIQFVHLLLYFIIITSAGELVKYNPIYGIVALACLMTVEKLLRQMFSAGKKADTIDAFDGATGAAVVMSGINKFEEISSGSNYKSNENKTPKLYINKDSLDAEAILMGDTLPGEGFANMSININNNQDNNSLNVDKQDEENNDNNNIKSSIQAPNQNNTEKRQSYKNTKSTNGDSTLFNDVLNSLQNNVPNKRTIKHPRLYAASYAGKNIFRGKPKQAAHKIGHGLLKGSGALLGATVGLAAGVASGDFGKTVKYTAAGAYATAKVTDNIGSGIIHEGQQIHNDYKQGRVNSDVQYASKERFKEFKKNSDNTIYLESRYIDKNERKEVYEVAEEATKYGIDDVEDISAIHEMIKKGRTSNQAMALAKMSNKIGNLIGKPKLRKDWKEKLMQDKFSEEQANNILDDVEIFQKQK